MKKKVQINFSMQICKLVAAIFVIFIHIGFPGRFGKIVECIARFAVPIFFAISGYFSYKIDNNKINKRIIHMLKLIIFAIFIYLVLGIIETHFIYNASILEYLHSVFNSSTIAKWFIINISVQQNAAHLWYLNAILVVYILLWIYVRFFGKKSVNYRPLYLIGVFLLFIHIFVSSIAAASGITLPYIIYRNAIFFGLPMFCLGIFIHQYHERIIKNFNLSTKKLIMLIILGLFISLIEYIGIGKIEMPIGMIVTVISLFLLIIKYPNYNLIKNKFVLFSLDKVPLVIYIIHPAISSILTNFIKTTLYENLYLYPIIVLGLSIIIGLLYTLLIFLFKIFHNKFKLVSKK